MRVQPVRRGGSAGPRPHAGGNPASVAGSSGWTVSTATRVRRTARQRVHRCTTCAPFPDLHASPTGAIPAPHSDAERPAGRRRRAGTTGRSGSGRGGGSWSAAARGSSNAGR